MITKAGLADAHLLSVIGSITFIDAHRESAPYKEIEVYVRAKYNAEYLRGELNNPGNIYHLIHHGGKTAGFSKMIFNSACPGLPEGNLAKLDQIYLLAEYRGQRLGERLMQFNMELAKAGNQAGMWLIVWKGNQKAISFYENLGFEISGEGEFVLTANHTSQYYAMHLAF